jgi:hypothetical protein
MTIRSLMAMDAPREQCSIGPWPARDIGCSNSYLFRRFCVKLLPNTCVPICIRKPTRGDTTYFLLHQLAVIRQATENLHTYLAHVANEQQNTEQLLAASQSLRSHLNHRQVALITHALKHPGEKYFVETHQRTHGVVYQTARTDLLKLASLGLLHQGRSGRAFHFTAPDDLKERIAAFTLDGAT